MRQSQIIHFSLAAALGILPSTAFALGLGNLQIISKPGYPLQAIIPVQSVTSTDSPSLLAGFPENSNSYTLAGIHPPAFGWKAKLQRLPSWHILITAPTPITRATSLLVQAHWAGGQVMREYRLPRGAAAVPAEHPVAPPSVSAPPPTPENLLYHGWSRRARYDRVPAGACLSEIAADLRGNDNVSVDQVMAALVRTNPLAFVDGDPNRLRAGVSLTLPNLRQVQTMTSVQAFHWLRTYSAVSRLPKTISVPHPKPLRITPITPNKIPSAVTHRIPISAPPKVALEKRAEKHLLKSNQVLQKKVTDMNALLDTLQTKSLKNDAAIQALHHSPDILQKDLPWAAVGGNILFLLLFVWMWRRQQETIEQHHVLGDELNGTSVRTT